VTGSYAAKLFTEAPNKDERLHYFSTETAGVLIFYPPELQVKEGFEGIQIRLKKFLFFKWLEMDGAKSLVCSP
jgi:hypothetical protein